MQSRHPNQPLHIILCHSSLILDICNDTQPTCVRRCMKTSGKTQKNVMTLSYEIVVGWNEWGTTQLTKTPPHSPYSTTKVSREVLFTSLLPHSFSLLGEKGEKKGFLCCKNWIAHIYRLQVPSVSSQKRLVGNGEKQNTRVQCSIPLTFFQSHFFKLILFWGLCKKKTMT